MRRPVRSLSPTRLAVNSAQLQCATALLVNPDKPPSADLEWREGQPYSRRFGDVYFSRDSGIGETRHVFLDGNRLPARWAALEPKSTFTIGETGFGTGLNFLCAWALWNEIAPPDARLHVFSTELHPLSANELVRALALWPELTLRRDALLAQWDALLPGWHRFRFEEGRVTLTLAVGDATEQLAALDAPLDAWFLDGFAPARNPEMWSDALFAQIARCSHEHTTLATYTSAGHVRRGLEAVGFRVEKGRGFGRKREMLHGEMARAPSNEPRSRPWLALPAHRGPRRAVVIGGGLAGTSAANSLAVRGWNVTLIERARELATGASGNPQGILYTRLAARDTPLRRIVLSGYLHSLRRLRALLPETDDTWCRCGVLQLAFDAEEQERQVALTGDASLAPILRTVSREEASAIAGIALPHGGLHFPGSGWAHPPAICSALADHPNIALRLATTALRLARADGEWRIENDAGLVASAPVVIIAAAFDTLDFAPTAHLPLRTIAGQLTQVPATAASAALKVVVSGEGGIAPARHGLHTIGATHRMRDAATDIRAADHVENLAMLARLAPALYDALGAERLDPSTLPGRAGVRISTPDYLPLVGPIADAAVFAQTYARLSHDATLDLRGPAPWLDGLWITTAHGSRGLITPMLAGELLASALDREPGALPQSLIEALHPSRFLFRRLTKTHGPR